MSPHTQHIYAPNMNMNFVITILVRDSKEKTYSKKYKYSEKNFSLYKTLWLMNNFCFQVDSAGGTIFCAEWAVLLTESRSHPGPPIGRQPGGEGGSED